MSTSLFNYYYEQGAFGVSGIMLPSGLEDRLKPFKRPEEYVAQKTGKDGCVPLPTTPYAPTSRSPMDFRVQDSYIHFKYQYDNGPVYVEYLSSAKPGPFKAEVQIIDYYDWAYINNNMSREEQDEGEG